MADPSESRPKRPQFGAARPGIAGQGATGSPAGDLPADKQAKSDFQARPARGGTPLEHRNGAANQTYGVGDLAPGGRTGLSDQVGRPADGSQGVQSGGRQGEGGAPPSTGTDIDLGGSLRDSGTDRDGRPQGEAWGGDPHDARTAGYDEGQSSMRRRGTSRTHRAPRAEANGSE